MKKEIYCRIWTKEGYQELTKAEWNDFDKTRLHRINGPAIEWPNGVQHWFINGKRHRLDGPAVEWADGSKYWYLNGKMHRLDGPAIEGTNGSKVWWINGKYLPKKEIETWIKENKIEPTTQEGQMALKLRWS